MAAGLSEVIPGIVGKLSLLAVQDLGGSVLRLGDLDIEQVISWDLSQEEESQRVFRTELTVFLCMCVYIHAGMNEHVYIHVYTCVYRGSPRKWQP